MELKYTTLKTIYEIVMNEASPLTYACFPNQIIIRQTQPWDIIIKQLDELAAEGLITIQQPGTTICITPKGMEKATTILIVQ
jgi:predicted transcriptional regulator